MQFENFVERVKPYHLFLIALVLSGLCAAFRLLPVDDVYARYAPASEAFAIGDWRYAFHPRFGVYYTSFAGVLVWLFHCSGVVACQITSVLLFAASVFPLHALFRKIWGARTAFWGTVCYVFCSHLLRYAGEGMRDNGKTLALAMIALALVSMQKDAHWEDVFLLAAGGALLTVIRGEGFMIAIICGVTAIFFLKDWKKSLAGILLFCTFIAPQCLYNHYTIGYFVPELRHGYYLHKMGVPAASHAIIKFQEPTR